VLHQLSAAIDRVYLDTKVEKYIVDVVHATRKPAQFGLSLAHLIQFGASPRGTISLALAAKAQAFLAGRHFVTPQDVKSVAPDVLRHRILMSYEAEADDITSDRVIQDILSSLPVP